MAYVPNPTDPTQPVESVIARTAAAEFRALKAYIQTLVLGTGQLAAFRNMLRNGDAFLNQRQVGSVTGNGVYADGWKSGLAGTARTTVSRNSIDHFNVFPQTHKFVVSTSGVAVPGDLNIVQQVIEANDMARLLYGTGSARGGTYSLWVYSAVTGQYSIAFQNSAQNRSCVVPFNVDVANTWERKTLTVPGDTLGAWLTGSNAGLRVQFGTSIGSTYLTVTPNVWQNGDFRGLVGQVQFCTAPNTTAMYLAEMQFEQSAFATPFEYLDFGTQLIRAKRYFQHSNPYGIVPLTGSGGFGAARFIAQDANNAVSTQPFVVEMRAAPVGPVVSQSFTGVNGQVRDDVTGGSVPLSVAVTAGQQGFHVVTSAAGFVANRMYEAHWQADSEF